MLKYLLQGVLAHYVTHAATHHAEKLSKMLQFLYFDVSEETIQYASR
jgi:hypothetical protein